MSLFFLEAQQQTRPHKHLAPPSQAQWQKKLAQLSPAHHWVWETKTFFLSQGRVLYQWAITPYTDNIWQVLDYDLGQ
jgi:hypothetical protein